MPKNREKPVWFGKERQVIVYDLRDDPKAGELLKHPRPERGRKAQVNNGRRADSTEPLQYASRVAR